MEPQSTHQKEGVTRALRMGQVHQVVQIQSEVLTESHLYNPSRDGNWLNHVAGVKIYSPVSSLPSLVYVTWGQADDDVPRA